jgi:glycyl-tRNA synthetase beta chain
VKPLLLEIGTEEIPARFLSLGIKALRENLVRLLEETHIDFKGVSEYATPRRLAVLLDNVSEMQKDRKKEILGPPKKASYDQKGNLTPAALGFARSQAVNPDTLSIVKTERGEYVAAVKEEIKRETLDVLSETLPDMIASLSFPKSMRWGSGKLRFVRPIKWITAIFGDSLLPFEIEGIKSTNMTRGHRFLSPGAFKLHDPSTYSQILLNNYVMADQNKRKNTIIKEIKKIESSLKCVVREDNELLEEVTSLVEYPTVIRGNFDPGYLSLPKELLTTVMKNHQKFFSVDDEKGNLAPHFLLVSNTKTDNNDTVINGAERVLKARLEDARFYFNEDRKNPLEYYVERLRDVTFRDNLGSVHEKAKRISSIGSFLADELGLSEKDKIVRASMLSKADLVTGIVREFPELQGYIGMIYALESGEDEEVASAVFEHYKPKFSGDELPSTESGAILSLSDKMDNIASFFIVGDIPSGSEDPYGLRRQAMGIIKILEEKGYNLRLDVLVQKAINALEGQIQPEDTLKEKIMRFFYQRLEGMLLSEGLDYDIVDAALASSEGQTLKNIKHRATTLSTMRKDRSFPELLTAAKRVYNILRKEQQKDVREDLFSEHAEKGLYKAVEKVRKTLNDTNFETLFDLTEPINAFFNSVLVMDENPDLKQNRINLLFRVKQVFDSLGDFSKIVEQ